MRAVPLQVCPPRSVWFPPQGGLVDPVDSTLRDFSGRCIEEFVKWSIKQTTPKQQERSPANMKSLFKRIYSLALHPNGFKRLGAALAFNSVYRLFRWAALLPEGFWFWVRGVVLLLPVHTSDVVRRSSR